MSTPLTRAMTGSDAEAGASDDEFFEQPEAAGKTNSSAAIVTNAMGRWRGAERGSILREVMAWSWIGRPWEARRTVR
jgi:hypothetical protein